MILPKEYDWLDISDPNFSKALNQIIYTKNNLNIIGCAGSGKSTLLKVAYSLLEGNTIVLSSTGISASNLTSKGIKGTTLHSFFRLPPLSIFPEYISMNNAFIESLVVNTDTFLIDECSMIPAALMDKVLHIMYVYRSKHNMPLPRIILFSDILQLPCIVNKNESDVKSFYDKMYKGKTFFFNSIYYQNNDFKIIHLDYIFRQKDTSFQNILNRIRQGTQTNEDLRIINERVVDEGDYFAHNDLFMYLASVNNVADLVNESYTLTYDGPSKVYHSVMGGKFDLKKYPHLPTRIELKKEMQVMCLKNNNNEGYQNGTLGKVLYLNDSSICIKTKQGRVNVLREKWEEFEYRYNENTQEVFAEAVGFFEQLAAKPAFAVTIHKSQGLEFDNIYLNIGYVTHGLAYVGLSRCRTLEGIGLDHPITHEDIKVSREALEFLEKEGIG